MGKRRFRQGFLIGVVAGIGFCLVVLSAAGFLMVRRGITVQVDLSGLAAVLADKIKKEAKAEIPDVLAEARSHVPGQVAEEMRGAIGSASVSIGELSVNLPDDMVADLEKRLARMVEKSVYGVFETMDLTGVVDNLAQRAYGMITTELAAELRDLGLSVKGPLNLSVPVTVKAR